MPQLTTPVSVALPAPRVSGPPKSPWQLSRPPWVSPAQIMLGEDVAVVGVGVVAVAGVDQRHGDAEEVDRAAAALGQRAPAGDEQVGADRAVLGRERRQRDAVGVGRELPDRDVVVEGELFQPGWMVIAATSRRSPVPSSRRAPVSTCTWSAVTKSLQCAAVTTKFGRTSVPPQNCALALFGCAAISSPTWNGFWSAAAGGAADDARLDEAHQLGARNAARLRADRAQVLRGDARGHIVAHPVGLALGRLRAGRSAARQARAKWQ